MTTNMIALWMLAFFVTSTPASDTPVARIGSRVIMHSEIACRAEIAALQRKTCLESEQLALDAQIVLARADEICRLNHIDVSPGEVEAANSRIAGDAAALFHAIGVASLALMDGRKRADVDAQILRPAGVAPELFDSFFHKMKSRADVQKFMAAHERSVLLKRPGGVNVAALKRTKLQSFAQARAARQHEPVGVVIQQMLDEATKSLGGIEILDTRFHLPKLIGVTP